MSGIISRSLTNVATDKYVPYNVVKGNEEGLSHGRMNLG